MARKSKRRKKADPPPVYKPQKHDVRVDGPDEKNKTREKEQELMGVKVGWNTGDIDFDKNGEVFIRNPYLANAIEALLKRNHDRLESGRAGRKERFIFRLTRDKGFSGEKINMVC